MSNYLIKGHHSIMRSTAISDYNAVLKEIQRLQLNQFIPKGASWQKVEDATALMINQLKDTSTINLNRGISYYIYLLPPPPKQSY